MNIAVLIACYNRKKLTIKCLETLEKSLDKVQNINVQYFILDDNSSDGTKQYIENHYSYVNIISGTGNLFWTGGMIEAFRLSEKSNMNFEGYLLVNDDVIFNINCFELLNKNIVMAKHISNQFILVGPTKDQDNLISYGGSTLKSKFFLKYNKIIPDVSKLQECDFGNANFMFISKNLISNIGFLSNKYKHGYSDFDYSYRASKLGGKVFLMTDFVGACDNNHHDKIKLITQFKNFKKRLNYVFKPNGYGLIDHLIFNCRNFPLRVPFFIINTFFLLFFPKLFQKITNFKRLFA